MGRVGGCLSEESRFDLQKIHFTSEPIIICSPIKFLSPHKMSAVGIGEMHEEHNRATAQDSAGKPNRQ